MQWDSKTINYKTYNKESYTLGKILEPWKSGEAQYLTFIVTEDCNLRCKYCYITHKSNNKKLDVDIAKKFIDYIFTDNITRQGAVVLDFIGGEPLIEVGIIDEITDYFKIKALENNDDWYWNYRINVTTNGVNYSDDDVQKFIKKNKGKISIGITLDGIKEKHDLQRVFPDGSGSFDTIFNNIPLWLSQFVNVNTKVTFASDDLKYLKDSIIFLWQQGIYDVAANVVFEDVWKEKDDEIFENQLRELADYVIENKLYDKFRCTLFDENLGGYYSKDDLDRTFCGAGHMIALGPDGKIYPCIRYKDYSLNKKDEWDIGNVFDGINMEKVRPFKVAMAKYQSDQECINCEVANGCGFCQAFNYDEADTPTNFSRAKYICKMHKARIRANNYYFARLFNEYGIRKEAEQYEKKLIFLLSDDYVSFCQNSNNEYETQIMDDKDIINGLNYAYNNFYKPIFVHSQNKFLFDMIPEYQNHQILHILPAKFYKQAFSKLNDFVLVFTKEDINLDVGKLSNAILNIEQENINELCKNVIHILEKSDRVNINILNLNKNFDFEVYEKQLLELKDYLLTLWKEERCFKELNVITDLSFIGEHNNCQAGSKTITYAPNGKLYICPAFYSKNKQDAIGDVFVGPIENKNKHLFTLDYQPICNICDAYQCTSCAFLNRNSTNEVNVPPSYQCKKGLIEREISRQYNEESSPTKKGIEKLDYVDPIEIISNRTGPSIGFYK